MTGNSRSDIPIELASRRKIRDRNKLSYRVAHWPIWVWVFFIAPGPLTFDLFELGFDARIGAWLGVVLLGTGIAGVRGRLPGVEPQPYIIRFTEDKPNPLYRRVCYTFAWSAVITFALLHIIGLVVAVGTGEWYMPAVVRSRLLSDRHRRLAAGGGRAVAARESVDERRGARAALLLRVRVGGLQRPADTLAGVDKSADQPRRGRGQAHRVSRDPDGHGLAGPSRAIASDTTDRPG